VLKLARAVDVRDDSVSEAARRQIQVLKLARAVDVRDYWFETGSLPERLTFGTWCLQFATVLKLARAVDVRDRTFGTRAA